MDLYSVSEQVVHGLKEIFPYITLSSNEILKHAGKKIKQSSIELLEKIKNKFGLERNFTDILYNIEENPTNEIYANNLKELILEALKNDENFRDDLVNYFKNNNDKSIYTKIKGNKNVIVNNQGSTKNINIHTKKP